MSSFLTIRKVDALPLTYTANTLYFTTGASGTEMGIYLSNNDGTSIRHVSSSDEILQSSVVYSNTPPTFPCAARLWWDLTTLSLYIQHPNDGDPVWAEANPSVYVPEFAGNGEASTMSRSDHWHDKLALASVPQW